MWLNEVQIFMARKRRAAFIGTGNRGQEFENALAIITLALGSGRMGFFGTAGATVPDRAAIQGGLNPGVIPPVVSRRSGCPPAF
jgi:hypothetical protein